MFVIGRLGVWSVEDERLSRLFAFPTEPLGQEQSLTFECFFFKALSSFCCFFSSLRYVCSGKGVYYNDCCVRPTTLKGG